MYVVIGVFLNRTADIVYIVLAIVHIYYANVIEKYTRDLGAQIGNGHAE